ncbi:MAG TPA: FAD/NAD(P)-binding oxidoreductase [Saprospiraceae bacterium]|nr:FAD/NAD(P)-binding oxidoreductase [Saprospiraceae bacterium]
MHIAIIGNGIAGSTAAIEIRKFSDHKITMISNESPFPYSRTALMYIFMRHLRWKDTQLQEEEFWKRNQIELIQDEVISIESASNTIFLKSNSAISYGALIIASGSRPKPIACTGSNLEGVHSLYHLQDLEKIEDSIKRIKTNAVIVGGGLIGIELAEMLLSRNIPIWYIIRESNFWNSVLPNEESSMVSAHIREHGIELIPNSELESIQGRSAVESVALKTGQKWNAEFVGICIGVDPNISWINPDSGISLDRGILVNEFLETNVNSIYAIGDCAQLSSVSPGRKSIEAIWYSAKKMGEHVAQTICKNKLSYKPGLWYNSAKFFDIEYQVYGDVAAKPDDDTATIFWKHPQKNQSIRINYHKHNKQVLGFLLMGIRYRQNVCLDWIQRKITIEEVISQLSLANFDPEFFHRNEQSLVQMVNEQHETQIKLRKEQKSMFSSFFKKKF